jgi:hypothetical protein
MRRRFVIALAVVIAVLSLALAWLVFHGLIRYVTLD